MQPSSYVSLITPFDQNKNIDLASFEKCACAHFDANVGGFFLGSEIGEGEFLNQDEKLLILERMRQIIHSAIPVFLEISFDQLSFQFLSKLHSKECTGVVISLDQVKDMSDKDLFNLFVGLSHLRLEVILKDVHCRPKSLIEELLALPYISSIYQKSSDVQRVLIENIKQFIEYDRGAPPFAVFPKAAFLSSVANINPKFFHELINTASDLSLDFPIKSLNKLSVLQREIAQGDAIANIKEVLSRQGMCQPFTRKKVENPCKKRIEWIEKKLEEIKKA
jgi:dihydrodipicolinate synthase/N-acetylneuraminate lyase